MTVTDSDKTDLSRLFQPRSPEPHMCHEVSGTIDDMHTIQFQILKSSQTSVLADNVQIKPDFGD